MSVLIAHGNKQQVPASQPPGRHRPITATSLSFLVHLIVVLAVIALNLGQRQSRTPPPDVVYLDLALGLAGQEKPAAPAAASAPSSAPISPVAAPPEPRQLPATVTPLPTPPPPADPAPDTAKGPAITPTAPVPAIERASKKITRRQTVVKTDRSNPPRAATKTPRAVTTAPTGPPADRPVSTLLATPSGQGGQNAPADTGNRVSQPTDHHSTGQGGQVDDRYLKENFDHIRQLILEHLTFPAAARKMGLKGKVTVRFTIEKTGKVSDLTILSSSGHKVLDAKVLSAIRRTAPFPKPRRQAQLILPIAFTLQ
ncbi:MAG: energy transducer TonB [Desulfopila sp.]